MPGQLRPRPDVAIVEDVWGPTFEPLADESEVLRVPDAWTRPAELPELLDGVRALVVRNRTTVDRALLAGRTVPLDRSGRNGPLDVGQDVRAALDEWANQLGVAKPGGGANGKV